MSFFEELKRRNVFRVGIAYAITAWLIAQIAGLAADSFLAPDWVMKMLITVLMLGFPISLVLAWAFELTLGGLRRESDIERGQSSAQATASKLDRTITIVLLAAVLYFTYDKFVLDPKRNAAMLESASRQIEEVAAEAESAEQADLVTDHSIAVLPFVNMSDDAGNEYFSEGLSEELLNMLVQIPELSVAARTSSFSFKGKDAKIADIARDLNVGHVLEGSVRKSGNRVRITAQLVKADDGFHLWSETYERTLDDIFVVQDEIAAAVVDALKINLLGMGPSTSITSPEVYELFLQGRHFLNQRTADGNLRAASRLEQAVEIDPDYAPAWALLSSVYLYQSNTGQRDFDAGFELAREVAQKAIDKDPDEAAAWARLGYIQSYYDWDWGSSARSYAKSLQLAPGSANRLDRSAILPTMLGQHDRAIAIRLEAIRLDPLSAFSRDALAYNYMAIGQPGKAEQTLRQLLDIHPEHSRGQGLLAKLMLMKGEARQALDILDDPVYSGPPIVVRAMALHSLGREVEAEAELKHLVIQRAKGAQFWTAHFHAWRGDPDAAFASLSKALESKYRVMAYIIAEPVFYPLHEDPRWPALLKHMGLLEAWQEVPPEYGGPAP